MFLMAASDAIHGTQASLLDHLASTTTFQAKKNAYFTRRTKHNDIICVQEIHGKDEFLQAVQVLARNSDTARLYDFYERRRIGYVHS